MRRTRGRDAAVLVLAAAFATSCGRFTKAAASGAQPAPPAAATAVPAAATPVMVREGRADLLWDSYGVAHIFAKDIEAGAFAFGWSQMRAHGDLLLRLYGQARGRGAEFWGESFAASDQWVLTNDIPERATLWLSQQRPQERSILESFAAGINAYATAHPDSINAAVRGVLPVAPTDVLSHMQRVLNFTFIASPQGIMGAERAWESVGSNAWAVSSRRSASRNALLLANPHLPWGDLFTWFEAQIATPEADAYGAALVGFPLLSIAFNDSIGWTHTVNTLDGADLYELTLSGDGYLFDGAVRPFETKRKSFRVKQQDGSLVTRTFDVRSSVHGPVIGMKNGKALALRVTGLDSPHGVQQTWEMMTSRNLPDLEHALSRLQLPFFTVIAADHVGNILHVFNGRVPVRSRGDVAYWQGVVRGDSSATLWTEVIPYESLPRIMNPPTGWLQNANEPPWTTTVPIAIDDGRFPAYLAPPPRMGFRAIRSARMLAEATNITLDQMIVLKHSTRSEEADHMLEDLVHAARATGRASAIEAAVILEKWDRSTDVDSRGALLFLEFAQAFNSRANTGLSTFDIAWTPRAPLATPDGIADPAAAVRILEAAAERVRARYGALDVSWGDTHRLVRDGVDLPANGGPGSIGVFRSVGYDSISPTRAVANDGDSYVAAIEFSTPVVARSIIGYGNWSQPGSKHRTDQLALFSRKELRTVWRLRRDIEQHLEAKEIF